MSDSHSFVGSDIDAPPPPRRTVWQQVRRRWLSLGRHRPLSYWILSRGTPIVVVFAVLFVLTGVFVGWRTAYEVLVLIKSPADTHSPFPWLLSIAGWLLVPAVAGAVAGHVVSSTIGERRTRSIDEILAGDEDE